MSVPTIPPLSPQAHARHILRDAGLSEARRRLADAPDILDAAQRDLRKAQAEHEEAKEHYEGALAEAEWTLDDSFVAQGNKTYLVKTCDECSGSGYLGPSKACPRCEAQGRISKPMTADERSAWKARESLKLPTVRLARDELRRCEERVAAARDAINVAERRFTACKYDLSAAVAEVQIMSLAVGAGPNGAMP